MTRFEPSGSEQVSDWDHLSDRWAADPFPLWDRLRERSSCPFTAEHGGAYLAVDAATIRDVARDPQTFSSRQVLLRAPSNVSQALPPITADPPEHAHLRRALQLAIAARGSDDLEDATRQVCDRLLAETRGIVVDASSYAAMVPATVLTWLLGLDHSHADDLLQWIQDLVEEGPTAPDIRDAAMRSLTGMLRDQITSASLPETCALGRLAIARRSGDLDSHEAVGIATLLVVAGIDTTWSVIGAAIWHLATHDDHRSAIVGAVGHDSMDGWVDELLRLYAPASMARVATRSASLKGDVIEAGQRVLLCYPAFNRDPEVFERPHELDTSRDSRGDATFGLGIHRCPGAPMARAELKIALEAWLGRFPDFRIDPDTPVVWSRGQIRGPRRLAVRIRDQR